jgi:hypothetical protein
MGVPNGIVGIGICWDLCVSEENFSMGYMGVNCNGIVVGNAHLPLVTRNCG